MSDQRTGVAPGTSGEDFEKMQEETARVLRNPDMSHAPKPAPGKRVPQDPPDFRHGQDT